MNTIKYVNSKEASKKLGVSYRTLRRWDSEGRINTIRIASGQRRYDLAGLTDHITQPIADDKRKKICYARVSSKKQADDLGRQEDFFRSRYPNHDIITDVGSGINWKRKGLKTLLDLSIKGAVSEIVVAHRDRLSRFCFELLEWLFNRLNVKLVVLDEDASKSPDQELSDDILYIIHVYSCRKLGRRRYKSEKSEILPEHEPEEDSE